MSALSLSIGILLFVRPDTFWRFAFCFVALRALLATSVLIFCFPSTPIGDKLAATVPECVKSLFLLFCTLRARSSDATSCT